MKRKMFRSALLFAVFSLAISSCKEEVYDPSKKDEKGTVKLAAEYFDFSTRSKIALNISLGSEGATTLVELYAENPYEVSDEGLPVKRDVEAVFKIYTSENGNWNGTVELPKAVGEFYLCPNSIGLPVCETVTVENGTLSYVYSAPVKTKANTRSVSVGEGPFYTVDADRRMYALCRWGRNGNVTHPADYLQNENLGSDWIRNVQRAFWNGKDYRPYDKSMDNTKYITDAVHLNTTIARNVRGADGTLRTIVDADVYFTFLTENAWHQNTVGYYYYPTDAVPPSPDEVDRFIILPNASMAGSVPFLMNDNENEKYVSPQAGASMQWLYKRSAAPVSLGTKVKLLYRQPDGTMTEKFPAGYTIGYFVISNGYGNAYYQDHTPYDVNLVPGVKDNRGYIYSNQAWNEGGKSSFVSVADSQTGRIIYGVEDGVDKSYDDMLFYIESTPREAVHDPDRPTLPPADNSPVTELYAGTFLFEDIWPTGGDYDMNDVIVEYSRAVEFDRDNVVTRITDTFRPVWDGASYKNAFAYQIDAAQVGELTLPEGAQYEAGTNSIIVFANAKEAKGNTYTVVRRFNGSLKKAHLLGYNPYIIVDYKEGARGRMEVHLPKHLPTDYANKRLNYTADDAYYIHREGKYPFAMDIPVHGFVPVTEKVQIGSEGEYPDFIKWAEGGGFEDWYLRKR